MAVPASYAPISIRPSAGLTGAAARAWKGGENTGGNAGPGSAKPSGPGVDDGPASIRGLPALGRRSPSANETKPGSAPCKVPVHCAGTLAAPVVIQFPLP